MNEPLKKRGKAHVFGHDIPLDEGVMAFRFAIGRVTDPEKLIPHLFEQVDATFANRVKPGDIVVAGRNFGHGKPHVQGYIAMKALGMGLLCESMPHKAFRRAVANGLPVLSTCENVTAFAATGDDIEVDFSTGVARNITRGTDAHFTAMAPSLADIVAQGGSAGRLRAFLAAHPELAEPNPGV
jgi:3-isopropylmalate/(R)-2-methylmalate dehydratase small subunit